MPLNFHRKLVRADQEFLMHMFSTPCKLMLFCSMYFYLATLLSKSLLRNEFEGVRTRFVPLPILHTVLKINCNDFILRSGHEREPIIVLLFQRDTPLSLFIFRPYIYGT
jgi:hypothetical protein